MGKKLVYFLVGIFLSFPILTFCQARQITGTVLNEKGEPIPLASVVIKGTASGVTADESGKFSINVSGNKPVLVISSTGLAPREISIGSSNNYNVTLTVGNNLSEVVVTALGVRQEKKALG